MKKFTIVVDTREKLPFTFEKSDHCSGCISKKIDCGDYSLLGLENNIFVERKNSIAEWAKNVTEDRFFRLLDNVSKNPQIIYRYIICSFDYIDICNYPHSLKVSPRVKAKIRMKPEFIKSITASIPAKYNIPIIFFPFKNLAEEFTFNYLKWIWRTENA